jgi:hypothetical protein
VTFLAIFLELVIFFDMSQAICKAVKEEINKINFDYSTL